MGIIKDAAHKVQPPWPKDVILKVGCDDESRIFVEVSVHDPYTVIRGEGYTVEEAEDVCWRKFEAYRGCSDGSGEHGPFERRQYADGRGFCTKCDTWMLGIFRPMTKANDREVLLGKLFGDGTT